MKVKETRKTSDQAHNDDDKVDDAEIDDIRETRFIRYIIGY